MSIQDRPNILFVYADQLREDMLSCAGNPVIRTPYMDRLAAEGVRCTGAFSSFPLCTPFRASLFTGKYNHSTGVYANHHPIPLGQDFLPQLLSDAGYATGYVGKWHLEGGAAPGFVPPGERRLGFEHLVGFNRGHYYLNSIYFHDDGKPRHCPRYEPDFQTEQMGAWLQSRKEAKDGKPFFGMICYGVPHFPFNMPEYCKTLYRPDEMPLGPTATDSDLKNRLAKSFKERNFPLASGVWGTGAGSEDIVIESEAEIRSYMAQYYGMTANMDWNLGRLLNQLDALDLTDNTMVVFFSDHGDMCGEHGYRCGAKKTFYRAAAQIPLLIRWPAGGITGGSIVDGLVDFAVDAAPTALQAANIAVPSSMQGVDVLPMLRGETAAVRDAVFYEVNKELEGPERFPIPERGVRTHEWLYVRTEAGPTHLYDLVADPDETRNMVHEPTSVDDVARMETVLATHMRDTNDDWSAEAFFPAKDFMDHESKSRLQQELLRQAVIEHAPNMPVSVVGAV